MFQLDRYSVSELIYESRKTLIYRGNRKDQNTEVIFKLLNSAYPDKEDIDRLKTEYAILQALQAPGIPEAYDLEQYENSPVLVMQYFPGSSLARELENKKLNLPDFLSIAAGLTRILMHIHNQNIIHKDINLSNFLWNKNKNQVHIIDFDISSKLSYEERKAINPGQLEGTLLYISPEQTGRMNRSIDYRTDFYSLGVCFYKMLTGLFPFVSDDPLELVYFHIARIPVAPAELDPGIPGPLSRIIMRLLAKPAEERYQNAQGLLYDLEQCSLNLQGNTLTMPEFEPGRMDISRRFRIPEKLYGREKELSALEAIFSKIAAGEKAAFFFTGPPGIGKSVLINELQKPVIAQRGFFIQGKFDPFKRNVPYFALIQALKDLVMQLFTEAEEKLNAWKKKILSAVGVNGQVLIDLIPEMEAIIGKQAPMQELPAEKALERFTRVFLNFFQVFAGKEHILVLVLDDLQWIDSASHQLINDILLCDELTSFLFAGGYRDNEVDDTHIIKTLLAELKKKTIYEETITLTPLTEKAVNQIISETLSLDEQKTRELTQLVAAKTGGNPFFIKEYLKTLHQYHLLTLQQTPPGNGKSTGWCWDMEKIKQTAVTDNVVILMMDKLKRLDSAAWDTLKTAACLGTRMSLDDLEVVCGKPGLEILDDLKEAINEGMMIKTENELRFAHDKVSEASYSLIDKQELPHLHYKIGKSLLDAYAHALQDEMLFTITSQLNNALTLLNSEEQETLLTLNLEAGKKARSTLAYKTAADFFKQGSRLFSNRAWDSAYAHTLAYYTHWAEAEYLARNFTEAENLFTVILKNSRNIMDQAAILSLKISNFTTQQKYSHALQEGLTALKLLGVTLSAKNSAYALSLEMLKAKMLLGNRKPETLVRLPSMQDRKKSLAMEIMYKCIPPAIISNPGLNPLLILKMVNLTLKSGYAPASSYAFILYAIILYTLAGDLESGYEFGLVATKLAEKTGEKFLIASVHVVFGFGVIHIKEHYRQSMAVLKKMFHYCLEAGNFEYLGYAYTLFPHMYIFSGENLESIYLDLKTYSSSVYQLKQSQTNTYFNISLQAVQNLLEKNSKKSYLAGSHFDEQSMTKTGTQSHDLTGLGYLYSFKLMLAYIFEEYGTALEYAQTAEQYALSMFGDATVQMNYFFHGLTLVKLLINGKGKAIKPYRKKLLFILKLYRKWGNFNKAMHYHKYLLLKAGYKQLAKSPLLKIADLYDQAILHARESGNLFETGLAHEAAACFYLEAGREIYARSYMTDAYYDFTRWGAASKAELLKANYPHLIALGEIHFSRITGTAVSVSATIDSLDLNTIIKASQVISREIRLKELLTKIMQIVIENAGAEKGFFLLPRGQEWFIEAECHMHKQEIQVLKSIHLELEQGEHKVLLVSAGIVNYVIHTRKSIILNETVHESYFNKDPYIIAYRPKSVFCLPLINKGKITSILYMENNLMADAFTAKHSGIMEILSAQMAISIENARIYHDLDELNSSLEQKVADRTQEINEKNRQIMDSITYAQNIQRSILPDDNKLNSVLKNHFIIWKPMEIVSGDFYWLQNFDADHFLIGVTDCTGHGVPGALMTMCSSSILSKEIDPRFFSDPSYFLSILNRLLKKALNQYSNVPHPGITDDGLDISCCYFDLAKGRVVFAGANQSLYYTRPGTGQEIKEICGDKQSIGYRRSREDFPYTNHEVLLQGNEFFFLTSDGFINQLGGERGFPLGKNKFKQFLIRNTGKTCREQQASILEELKLYQGNYPQIDDITVLGFQVKSSRAES